MSDDNNVPEDVTLLGWTLIVGFWVGVAALLTYAIRAFL